MKVSVKFHTDLKLLLAGMRQARRPWWEFWRDVADYFLPRRYRWLMTERENRTTQLRNRFILDPRGTMAAKILASGMMNGITSPSRPWLRLRIAGRAEEISGPVREWLDEVTRRMLLTMAESNWYNALAVMYLDLVIFGTASMLIYEDEQDVVRCYNNALGEYYLDQGPDLKVNAFAREFNYTVRQCVTQFGEENTSNTVKDKWKLGGARLLDNIKIIHVIQPNDRNDPNVNKAFPFVEYYWEETAELGNVLSAKGFFELPGIFPRWETVGNDVYGVAPAMDALPDVIQLQHETKAKGQSLDYMNRPPVLADIQLEHRPTSLLPKGITYIAGLSNGHVGAKPIYTVTPPLREMGEDIAQIQVRIGEHFHNDLFRMISQLDTVRSATEIDGRREEKLVLLGPVLERFENEALDPGILRLYGIMNRAGLIPEMPPGLEDSDIEIQYVSILSDAQRAVGTVSVERFVQFVGNLAGVRPEVLDIPDWDELVRDYGDALAVPSKNINDRDETAALREARQQKDSIAQASAVADPLTNAARNLSETNVGGGANALQSILGG